MYLLDTHVVSEIRKVAEGKSDARVAAWQAQVNKAARFISVVTLMELEIGLLRIERRDATQGNFLRQWLNHQVKSGFEGRALPVDTAVAQHCATLHVPDPRPERDAMMAATALAHGMTVVTRGTADFEPTGVALLDPWQYGTVHEATGRHAKHG